MSIQLTDSDRQQIASLGLTEADVNRQIDNFRKGFPQTHLVEAATGDNGGDGIGSFRRIRSGNDGRFDHGSRDDRRIGAGAV